MGCLPFSQILQIGLAVFFGIAIALILILHIYWIFAEEDVSTGGFGMW